MDRQTASRSKLAGLLWSDRGEQQARNSLRQALLDIRASGLDLSVEVSRMHVAIMPGHFETDLEAVAALAAKTDCAAMALALSKIDGEFLEDLNGLSPAFDEWLQIERPRQRDKLFATAMTCAIAANGRATAEVRPLLTELERLDPLDEAVVRMRLQIDYTAGDIAAVHRRYRRLVDDLARELSAAPSRETQDMFHKLVARSSPILSSGLQPGGSRDADHERRGGPLIGIQGFQADGDDHSRFAATLTDRVARSLGSSTELRVLLNEAVPPEEMPAILRRAVAAFSLRGSIRQIGDTVALNVQLTNAHTGRLIWSDGLDVNAASLEMIEPLVERIAGAIGPATDRELASTISVGDRIEKDDPSVLYAHGKRLVRESRTLDGVRAAMKILETVVELDPRHVSARLRLAQLYNTDLHYLIAGHDVTAMRDEAFRLVLEAADHQPDAPRVRLLLAWCQLRRGDYDGAKQLLKAVEAEMPHDPDLMNECGFALAMIGEVDAGRILLQRAFRLNPFPPAEYHADIAVLHALAADHEAAEAHFALCGEQRLFWRVVRLCNLHRMGSSASQLTALDARLISTFRSIWTGSAPPELSDLLAWGQAICCFRRIEHRKLIADGLTAAWTKQPQVIVDNAWSTVGVVG